MHVRVRRPSRRPQTARAAHTVPTAAAAHLTGREQATPTSGVRASDAEPRADRDGVRRVAQRE